MASMSTSSEKKGTGANSKNVVVDGKSYQLNDVVDGITTGFSNNVGLKTVDPVLVGFNQLTTGLDSFNLADCISTSNFNINMAYKCITNSLSMNTAKKNGLIQKVKLSNTTYFIVPKLKPSPVKNVISFNRFMAICIGAIRLNLTKMCYNWEKNEYISTGLPDHTIPEGVGNKLALSCGFDENHDLYWFYASGFEFTFAMYPIEAICCVMMRLENTGEFKLEKMDELDLVKNLAAQISKKGTIISVIEKLGYENIIRKYNEYNSARTEQIGIKRTKDALGILRDLINRTKK